MAGGPGDLYALAVEYLNACEAAVTTAPGGAISRAFVSPGPPAWDCCPQLTVHAGGPAVADTLPLQPPLAAGHRTDVTGGVHLINLTATVIRCSPVLEQEGEPLLPSPVELEASAEETMGDVWAIWNYVRRQHQAGTLFSSPSGRRELFFDPAVVLATMGGCAGWQIQIRVQLNGYV